MPSRTRRWLERHKTPHVSDPVKVFEDMRAQVVAEREAAEPQNPKTPAKLNKIIEF